MSVECKVAYCEEPASRTLRETYRGETVWIYSYCESHALEGLRRIRPRKGQVVISGRVHTASGGERSMKILEYWLAGFNDREIGAEVGLSRERVRQLRTRGDAALRFGAVCVAVRNSCRSEFQREALVRDQGRDGGPLSWDKGPPSSLAETGGHNIQSIVRSGDA